MGLFPATIVPLPNDVDAAASAIFDVNGNQLSGFDSSRPANVTVASVPQSATDVVLQAANPARRRIIIVNNSPKNLFVKFGSAASLTVFSFEVASMTTYTGEVNDYTGVIHGIWSTAGTGAALVTEVTT